MRTLSIGASEFNTRLKFDNILGLGLGYGSSSKQNMLILFRLIFLMR